jgi:hypothetical protein
MFERLAPMRDQRESTLKKITILFLLGAIISLDYAQGQVIKAYGIKVAYTSADQRFDFGWTIEQTERRSGFNIAAYAEWPYLPFLSLVTQLEYAQRGVGRPYIQLANVPNLGPDYIFTRLDYISIPVFAKLSLSEKVLSPYIICGPRCDFLLGYKANISSRSTMYDEFKKAILGASIGGGLELHAPIGLLLEARYNFDLVNSYKSGSFTVRNNAFDVWVGVVL